MVSLLADPMLKIVPKPGTRQPCLKGNAAPIQRGGISSATPRKDHQLARPDWLTVISTFTYEHLRQNASLLLRAP
jgi:hypothetical protein